MKVYQTSEIRNIALIGGAKSGKTTLDADYFLSKSDDFEKIDDVISNILTHINHSSI